MLTRNLSGDLRPQSSQVAEPLWIDPGIKSAISVRELISTSKKKEEKAQAGDEWSNIFPKSSQVRKKLPPHNNVNTLYMHCNTTRTQLVIQSMQ